jgi:uncharacterized membrane protein
MTNLSNERVMPRASTGPDVEALQEVSAAAGADTAAAPPGRVSRVAQWSRLTLPGCWGAVLLAALSFTPSLLPRGGLLQGIVCGINAAIGYGLGVLAAWIWRACADRPARVPDRRAWRIFAVIAIALLVLMFGLGQYWQHEIRQLMGVSDYDIALVVASPLIAVVMFAVLLLIGRGIRRLYRRLTGLLRHWIGPRAAAAVGWILAACLVYLLVTGVLLQGLSNLADKAFSVRDTITEEGVVQPATGLRSGGPQSLVPWDTLGRQGRNFTGSGPSANDIQALVHLPATEPIRAYAGLASADDTESRAQLAVADLERAGGFERASLLVVTTTGSGWVDPALIDSFEYLSGGDASSVAIQYSYLPSWISYLVDQSKAREAGRALFDAVYEHWLALPQDRRPKLYVAGESLGSFGGETAFSGEYDLRNRTAGTLFVGPPNFNTLFSEFRELRDTGSPEIEPVFKNGRTVRFSTGDVGTVSTQGQPWEGNRVLYLMHPSDPIVWWSPSLLLSKPDWVDEPPGHDVLDTVWVPFLTFWQITGDLPFSTGVPGGHGHKYTSEQVDAWYAVMRPAAVSQQALDSVRAMIARAE